VVVFVRNRATYAVIFITAERVLFYASAAERSHGCRSRFIIPRKQCLKIMTFERVQMIWENNFLTKRTTVSEYVQLFLALLKQPHRFLSISF
jgi:hypothetical protein